VLGVPRPIGGRPAHEGARVVAVSGGLEVELACLGDPHLLDREPRLPQRAEHSHEVGADLFVRQQLSGMAPAVEAAMRDADPVQLIRPDRALRFPG
jgi:hypothetical protein